MARSGLAGWWDDITGVTQAREKNRAEKSQKQVMGQAKQAYNTGSGLVQNAGDYWKNWTQNPSAAWNATMPTAMNTGGAMAGMATNSAVNAARGSGLNAGQAALAGGAQSSNAFTQGALGAQSQLVGAGMNAASGMAGTGAQLTGQGMNAGVDIAGQQQNQSQYDTGRNDKGWATATNPLVKAGEKFLGLEDQ